MPDKATEENLSEEPTDRNQLENSIPAKIRKVFKGIASKLTSINAFSRMQEALDAMKEEASDGDRYNRRLVGTAIAASTGLSVGYVVWLIRSGMLLSSVLSSMPAWRLADPLVILSGVRDEEDEDESLDDIIDKESNDSDDRDGAPEPPLV